MELDAWPSVGARVLRHDDALVDRRALQPALPRKRPPAAEHRREQRLLSGLDDPPRRQGVAGREEHQSERDGDAPNESERIAQAV
jgi:hypothetical protein